MRIGIDLGGTKIEAVALGPEGQELERRRIATPRHDYEGSLHAVRDLVHDLEGRWGPGTVGMGMPGAVSPATGLIKNANSVWLNGKPLARDLQRVLGREVRLANDANCFALSEAVDGAGRNHRLVFGVIVGTGTGGGIVLDRQVWEGPNAIAGEWGHNPLPWPQAGEVPGPECYCGRRGCIETYLSGPGLEREHRERTGDACSAAELGKRAGQGDVSARASLDRYADRMARALASVLNLLDPEVVVLGGGLSQLSWLYGEIPKRWGRFVFSDRVATRLEPPRHGDAGGVRGAAWLWSDPATPSRGGIAT